MRVRIYNARREEAAIKIQRWYHRFRRLILWRRNVYNWQVVKVQAVIRRFLAKRRRRRLTLKRIRFTLMVLRVQSVWRRKIRFRATQMHAATLIQTLYRCAVAYRNHKLTRVKIAAQERVIERERTMRKVQSTMLELDKVLSARSDYWPGEVELYVTHDKGTEHPIQRQNQIAETLMKHRATIRKLFVAFSMMGEADAKRAFKMSKQQFRQYIKAIGFQGNFETAFACANDKVHRGHLHLGAHRTKQTIEELKEVKEQLAATYRSTTVRGIPLQTWNRTCVGMVNLGSRSPKVSNGNSEGDAEAISGLVLAAEIDTRRQDTDDGDNKTVAPNEFVHSMTLLADATYPEIGHPNERLDKFLCHLDAVAETLDLKPRDEVVAPKTQEIQAVFDHFNNRLIRLFRHYNDAKPDVQRAPKGRNAKGESDVMDCYEWMMLCQDCKVTSASFCCGMNLIMSLVLILSLVFIGR